MLFAANDTMKVGMGRYGGNYYVFKILATNASQRDRPIVCWEFPLVQRCIIIILKLVQVLLY